MNIIRYLYAGSLSRKPAPATITAALDRIVEASAIEPIDEVPGEAWGEDTQWAAGRLLRGGSVLLSGDGKLAYCQVIAADVIDEHALRLALKRSLKGDWREIHQDSHEVTP